VTLIDRAETGKDPFGAPIYADVPITVENVLIAPASADDIVTSTDLYGKKAVYLLGIPKGDAHTWDDRLVQFFGQTWRVFGLAQEGIADLVPLGWNKKVMVERYG